VKRATRPRALLLLIGALATIAGIVWGAGHARVDAKMAITAGTAPVAAAPLAAISAPAASAVTAPTTVAGATGMRIFKDPETGEIGLPTAESSALETDANSEDMTGLTTVTLPDGSIMIDLQGRFQESMVMQITPSGERVVTCTRDVKKTLAQTPTTTQREER
jgi:hypothetical protein